MFDVLFVQIAAVIVTAGLMALLARILRQPLIIAYILTGLIVGPSVLGFADSPEVFEALSEIGIAFLLFLVGLDLNWRNVKDIGMISVLGGFGQVIFTSVIGYMVASALGFDVVTSLFIAIAISFSSTIIIIKLLSDKEDLDRFYGRVSVGILIVQDLIAMSLLLILGTIRGGDLAGLETVALFSVLKLLAVIIVLWIFAKWILEPVFKFAARSQELLLLIAIAWCFALASTLHLLGFGIEIGALLAGVSLAGFEFNREIGSKIRPLRDFFLVIFFIVLGTTLTIGSLQDVLVPALILSLLILVGNPIILLIVLRVFGYQPRTGFLVGLTMAQISEFSFIFLAGGITAGLISEDIFPLITIVGLITIGVCTYLIKYNERLYDTVEFLFRPLEIRRREKRLKRMKTPSVILFGYHRIGETIMPTLKSVSDDYLVVDIDPKAIETLAAKRLPHMYGDAGDEDLLAQLRAEKSKIIISTIPDASVAGEILRYLKQKRSRAVAVVTVKTPYEAADMYALGANFVIVPNILGGAYFADMLKKLKTRKTAWSTAARRQNKAYGLK